MIPRERAKSVGHEATFDVDVSDDGALQHELVRLVMRVASDLRGKGIAARTITVKLKDSDFRSRSASRTLEVPIVADRVILEVAHALLQRLRRTRRTPARLLGVALSGLADGEEEGQLSLFAAGPPLADSETPRDRAITTAVDALRARFGADAIVPGRLAGDHSARGTSRAAATCAPDVPNVSPAAGAPRRAPGRGAPPSGR